MNLSNISGFRIVVVYTGMAKAARSWLASEQASLKQLGTSSLCAGGCVLGVLQFPRSANPVTVMSTPRP